MLLLADVGSRFSQLFLPTLGTEQLKQLSPNGSMTGELEGIPGSYTEDEIDPDLARQILIMKREEVREQREAAWLMAANIKSRTMQFWIALLWG